MGGSSFTTGALPNHTWQPSFFSTNCRNYYSYPNHGLTTPLEALRAALPPRVKVTHDKRTMYAYSPQNAAADVERCKVGGTGSLTAAR